MSTYKGNGQYDLKKLSIFYKIDGDVEEKELDLTSGFFSINLFESIFDPTMSGYVTIIDTYNVQDLLPLYGNERIELEFATLGNDRNTLDFKGRVYKISEKYRLSEHAHGFSIHFCSEELINSHKQHVQSGYDEEVSSIVKKIYNQMKRKDKPKNLELLPTKGVDKFVIGTMNPIDGIGLLSSYAYSREDDKGYLFYEDNKQFNFVALQHLYQQDPVIQYTYRQGGSYADEKNKINEAFVGIQDITIFPPESYIDRGMNGMHGSTTYRFDLYSKDYEKYTYTKDKGFVKTKSLGNMPFKKSQESNEAVGDFVNRLKISSNSKFPIEPLVQTQMAKAESNEFRAEIKVFGDSNIRCGQICFSRLPNWNMKQETNKNMVDGNFIIASINHNLTQTDYTQIIMLQKESYTND